MNRLSLDTALRLYRFAPLDELQSLSSEKRFELHPHKKVLFVVDSNPNYTNICDIDCSFCAFYRTEKSPDKYSKTIDEVLSHIEYAASLGATTVLLQGGVHPGITIDYLESLVVESLKRFPLIHPHYFSAVEIWNASKVSSISTKEALQRLWNAGQRTLPGGGAEILSERVRKIVSPKKIDENGWCRIHEEAHQIGFKTTATMMFGHVETDEELIDHMLQLRAIQDRTSGFTSFIPWSYKRNNTALRRRVERWAGREKYLRVLAIARLILDNIPHIGASWFSEGKEIGMEALHYGADDFGGTILEENVHKSTGHTNTTHVEGIIRMIRQAGFEPVQRNSFYEIVREFPESVEKDSLIMKSSSIQEIEEISS